MYFCLSCGLVLFEEEAVAREDQVKMCLDCYTEYEEDAFPFFYE